MACRKQIAAGTLGDVLLARMVVAGDPHVNQHPAARDDKNLIQPEVGRNDTVV